MIDNVSVPVAYCLLPGFAKNIYTLALTRLKEQIDDANMYDTFSPRRIMLDGELAAILACREIFPLAILTYCNFHFGKNLFTHVQSDGILLGLYNAENGEFRLLFKCFNALAFIPVDMVYPAFCLLISMIMELLDEDENDTKDSFIRK